ncbi:MAG: hemerythrin domain-containing protein [Desulfobacterales bacterium]|nr:hemerythrin domain-containing protein [Desulfobacterales bacterium]
MELKWQEDFKTGNDAVDFQHRFFIELINRIENDLRESKNDTHKRNLLVELKKYAEFHFSSEENIAISYNLPGVSYHHERHVELLDELNRRKDSVFNDTKSLNDFFHFLIEWFIGHTFNEDQKLFKKISAQY